MKNMLLRLAVAGLYLVASPESRSEVPTSLPLGSGIMLDWIVNRCSVIIILQTTNSSGGLNTCGMSGNNLLFSSYGDFQSYIALNSSRLLDILNDRSSTSVNFRVKLTYVGLDSQGLVSVCSGLSIDTNLGPAVATVNSSFYVTPNVAPIVLPFSGVASASVQFGNDSYVSLPLAGTNGVVWDNLFATNSSRARISLTFSDGETAVYTQGDNLILPPTVSMIWIPAPTNYLSDSYQWYDWYWYVGGNLSFNSYNLFINGSSGADTVVESTSDFSSWTPIGDIPWNSSKTYMVIPISPISINCPMQFFRARSY